jgi:hypothetical protein
MDIPTRMPGWVAPFGYPRINASLQLPAAFRSLARPSSPLYAKASTVCPSIALYCMACTTRRPHFLHTITFAHELDLPRSKLLCTAVGTTAHTFSFLFYYPHYVKEQSPRHSRRKDSENSQGTDPRIQPAPHTRARNRHLPYHIHYLKKPPQTPLVELRGFPQRDARGRTPDPACGATGIRTPDPLLAKQVL